jgi:ATP-binding cassette, subfamily F, member 2
MESIDALAKAVNEFEGGLILVSHDMRLISQVAREIWICDNKTITKYQGDIQNFKMDMRAQMGIAGDQVGSLRGDASVKRKEGTEPKPKVKPPPKKEPSLEVIAPKPKQPVSLPTLIEEPKPSAPVAPAPAPPVAQDPDPPADGKKRYIPPHLRRKMQEEKQ